MPCHMRARGPLCQCVCVGSGNDVTQLPVSPVRAVGSAARAPARPVAAAESDDGRIAMGSAARAPAGPVAAGESDDGRIAMGRTKLISLTPPVSRAWPMAALFMRRPRGEATLGEWLGEIGEASGDGLCPRSGAAA